MKKSLLWLLTMQLLYACSDGAGGVTVPTALDDNNPNVTPAMPISFELRLANGAAAKGFRPLGDDDDVTVGSLAITSASVHLREVRFTRPAKLDCALYQEAATSSDGVIADCDSDPEKLTFAGPFRVDLLTGESQPNLALALPVGRYDSVELRIEDDEETGPLQGSSLLAYGNYTTASSRPIRLALRFNEDARFAASSAAEITAASQAALVVNISQASWLAGVPEAIAECLAESEDDELFVGDGEFDNFCDELDEVLKENFKSAGELDHEDREEGDAGDDVDDDEENE